MSTPTVAAALGRGQFCEYKGRSYELAPVDHAAVVADYQRHLRERALAEVDTVRILSGPVAGDCAMRAYLDNSAAGVYDFGSPYWLETIQHPVNQKALLLFCLRAKDRTVTRSVAEEVWKEQADVLAKLLYGDEDPAPSALDGPDPGNA